jgi:hypothetical protein
MSIDLGSLHFEEESYHYSGIFAFEIKYIVNTVKITNKSKYHEFNFIHTLGKKHNLS